MAFFLTQNIAQNIGNAIMTSHHITPPKPSICEGIPCDHGDGFYPEGDCAQCFCRCVGGAHYETCCAPGLAFNPAVEQCDW